MPTRNFKLLIEYDGSCFSGWQRQKHDRTIQAEIEQALATMTKQKIVLNGSGRTDAGVHALGQTANFYCDTNLPAVVFHRGLNCLLPEDIVIKSCEVVPHEFHARFDARSKIYRYRILNRELPQAVGRQYAWFVRKELNLTAMQAAAVYLVGKHDFKAFEGSGSPRSSSLRRVIRTELFRQNDDMIVFEIEADGFLRFMVRNIVGTLVDVGLQKITPRDLKDILLSADRNRAGITAPPQGLFLVKVRYD